MLKSYDYRAFGACNGTANCIGAEIGINVVPTVVYPAGEYFLRITDPPHPISTTPLLAIPPIF